MVINMCGPLNVALFSIILFCCTFRRQVVVGGPRNWPDRNVWQKRWWQLESPEEQHVSNDAHENLQWNCAERFLPRSSSLSVFFFVNLLNLAKWLQVMSFSVNVSFAGYAYLVYVKHICFCLGDSSLICFVYLFSCFCVPRHQSVQ